MGGGKSGGTSTTVPSLSPEQNAMIKAQTGFFQNTIAPSYDATVRGATDLYNREAGGLSNAAQNLAGTAMQAQNVLGSTGQSAVTSGINALQNIASPDYQQAQIRAALMPAQAQYAQNIANQEAQFGGAGQMGSARQALAERQTAGSAQAQQEAAVAQALQGISQQQLAAGGQLAGYGQAGLGQALGAAGQGITAAMAPQQLYNQYSGVQFGTPSQSYSPNFSGTQGSTTNTSQSNLGFNILPGLSDIRAKENISYVGMRKGHRLYHFNYKGKPERYEGVMAHEVYTTRPDAVVMRDDGYLAVHYDRLGLAMTQIQGISHGI